MTCVAPDGCLALLVAVDAPLHLERLLKAHDFLRCDVAMTTRTLSLRCRMRTVAEEHKARQLMDKLHRDFPVSKIHVTGLALCQGRKARPIRPSRVLVAQGAFVLQRRVLLVIERPVLRPQTQGKENATKESEYVSLYLLPPPAAITTYCFLVFFE